MLNRWRTSIALALLALIVAACGGGDPEDQQERRQTQPVNCHADPRLCA